LETLIRFLIGGAVVSLFALLGDLLRPKGFAGLFAAAPSVALATLAVAAADDGRAYVSLEARSMVAGEIAFIGYAVGCVYLLGVRRTRPAPTTALMLLAWGIIAASLYAGALGSC
jgi:uncharacterized membrane protein (GlpM family)